MTKKHFIQFAEEIKDKVLCSLTMKELFINNVYRLKDGGLVVFLGYQDNKSFGFFRELNNPDTFFGLKLTKLV